MDIRDDLYPKCAEILLAGCCLSIVQFPDGWMVAFYGPNEALFLAEDRLQRHEILAAIERLIASWDADAFAVWLEVRE